MRDGRRLEVFTPSLFDARIAVSVGDGAGAASGPGMGGPVRWRFL
jgi:hypothetical protein